VRNYDEKAAHPRDVDARTNNESKRGPTPARFRDEGAETSDAEGGEVDGTGCGDVEMLSGDDSSESSDSEPEFESEEEMRRKSGSR
jgi:hypothetical protein